MEKLACFTVVKPQGIKGELKARILADGIYSVQGIKKLYTEDGNEYGVVKIKDAFSGFAFITLQSIATRNDAELLRGVTFYAPKNSIKKAKDEYFITDIIGMKVFVSGEEIGSVKDVIQSNVDMFEIKLFSGKSAYFPYLKKLDVKLDFNKNILSVEKEVLDGVIYYED